MGEVAWWMVRVNPELGSGSSADPVVVGVTKDDVGRLTGLAADALTLVQVSLGCGLGLKSPAFPAPLLSPSHQLAFGMVDRLAWEDLVNSDQSFNNVLSVLHLLASARSGEICSAYGSKPDKCPGQLNHTQRQRFWAKRFWANGNRRPEHE